MNRADKILNSLEGLKKAAAPDFFYTRLSGKMQNRLETTSRPFILLRPAFITTALFVVLMVNVISIISFNKVPVSKTAAVPSTQPATIESFAQAYQLNTESVYE